MHPELLRTAGPTSVAGHMSLAAALLVAAVVAAAVLFFWGEARRDGERPRSRDPAAEPPSE